jgi:hypothetical protein
LVLTTDYAGGTGYFRKGNEKWHRLPADEISSLIGKDANATGFPDRPKAIGKRTLA